MQNQKAYFLERLIVHLEAFDDPTLCGGAAVIQSSFQKNKNPNSAFKYFSFGISLMPD